MTSETQTIDGVEAQSSYSRPIYARNELGILRCMHRHIKKSSGLEVGCGGLAEPSSFTQETLDRGTAHPSCERHIADSRPHIKRADVITKPYKFARREEAVRMYVVNAKAKIEQLKELAAAGDAN